ncbi:MAG TPA: ABC transporter permease [Candidatus Acidoferrales bacterium]|nr:ABC transporter permease [Candidatus Acidoferrales bacterium]
MSWLRQLFWRRRLNRELSEEIRAHLDEKADELVAGEMERREAQRAARREFGNVMLMEQRGREVWRWPMIEDFLADVRYALRGLRKAPGFTVVAVLTLGLGIGANTAIFSFVDAWLIKPLPFMQPERMVVFISHNRKQGWTDNTVTSTAAFYDFQSQSKSFDQIVGWAGRGFNFSGDGPPALIDGGRVSWNFFAALGAKPLLGRTFRPEEDRPGTGRVAVIDEGLWKSRFAQDPHIVGRVVTINGEGYAVVGVMPATFQFPLMGIANVWTPLALSDKERSDRNSSWICSFGRLKPGVNQALALAETTTIFSRLEREYPKTDANMTVLVKPFVSSIRDNQAPMLTMLLWIVALILLIASANVANLMLARATGRAREMALRAAMGAARGRLIRQLLAESLLLFFFGGVAGVLFGVWGIDWIETLIPRHDRGFMLNYGYVRLDLTTLLFTLAIALACGLVFGLAPALEGARLDLNRALKEASGRVSDGRASALLRRVFVAGEIALAVVVLVATTLLVRSVIAADRSNMGFDPANVITAQLQLPTTKYPEDADAQNFQREVLARIRALPGVADAGVASGLPFAGFGQMVGVEAIGKPAPEPGETLGAHYTAVSPGYFAAMRIPLLRGRAFTADDAPGNAPVAIISQTFAREFWPGEDPIGQKITFGEQHQPCTIVGVVNDVKMYSMRAGPQRQMYVPMAQFRSRTLGFAIRTAGDQAGLAAAIRQAVWSVDASQPVSSVEFMQTLMYSAGGNGNSIARLMILFGLLAMFLGAIGIYGLMSHLVSQRNHEIAIRMALGANPLKVMRMIVGQCLRLAAIGIGIGLVGALAVSRSLVSLLYRVNPTDAATYAGVAILFAVVALAACYIPARRAMRVEPVAALRSE